jgi:hypothetical protein
MKTLLVLSVLMLPFLLKAQGYEQRTLSVGSYIYINPCKKGKKYFESMDVYARTKPMNKSRIDSATGEGIFTEFFKETSIDAKRLPCIMGGHKYKIAALQEFNDKGTIRRVVLCYTSYHLTMIWIELDKAVELGEIDI